MPCSGSALSSRRRGLFTNSFQAHARISSRIGTYHSIHPQLLVILSPFRMSCLSFSMTGLSDVVSGTIAGVVLHAARQRREKMYASLRMASPLRLVGSSG